MSQEDFITYVTDLNTLARKVDKICDVTELEFWNGICGDLFDMSINILATCFKPNESENGEFIECLYDAFWRKNREMTPEDWRNFYDEWSNK